MKSRITLPLLGLFLLLANFVFSQSFSARDFIHHTKGKRKINVKPIGFTSRELNLRPKLFTATQTDLTEAVIIFYDDTTDKISIKFNDSKLSGYTIKDKNDGTKSIVSDADGLAELQLSHGSKEIIISGNDLVADQSIKLIDKTLIVPLNNKTTDTTITNSQQALETGSTLAGQLIANLGSGGSLQPTIALNRQWGTDRFAGEVYLTAFQQNKDTTRYVNAVNLFKSELSNLNIRMSFGYNLLQNGKFNSLKTGEDLKTYFGFILETNFYTQTINRYDSLLKKSYKEDLASFLAKFGLAWMPIQGFELFLKGQYYGVMTGDLGFESVFGKSQKKNILNAEASVKITFDDPNLKGFYINPTVIFNNNQSRELLGVKDGVVFVIRTGYKLGLGKQK